MSQSTLYAVLTGDVTGSSVVPGKQRHLLLDYLKGLFTKVEAACSAAVSAPFQIYRGDSFQSVLTDPSLALRVIIVLRAGLRTGLLLDDELVRCDARVAIGIGTVDFLPGTSAEADGEAFRKSGRLLDRMADDVRLLIESPAKEVDDELNVEFGLLDAMVDKWSSGQAEAIMHMILGLNQREIAQRLSVTSAAINQRLKGSGLRALEGLLDRFELLIRHKVCGLNNIESKPRS